MVILTARSRLLLAAIAAVWISTTTCSFAQEDANELFPTDAAAWLNSPPISSETLDGKAAVLYFFEEG